LARPGGNLSGFINAEPGATAKFVDLIREIAPAVTYIAAMEYGIAAAVALDKAIAAAASSMGLRSAIVYVDNVSEIENAIGKISQEANTAPILPGDRLRPLIAN
jgi:putative tryptophan/tyrosine transport system substrate-binding protein